MIETYQSHLTHWEMQLNHHIGPNWKDNYPKYSKMSFTKKLELTDKILRSYRHLPRHKTVCEIVNMQYNLRNI
jgi:hypothetical protein